MERHEPKPASGTAPGTPILPLPEDVVAQIKSSTTIVSLTGVVLGLLKNALDARATKVEATVDFSRGGCSVEDNGLGIAPSEFREEGGLGKLYCTSKYYSEDVCLGRHGTFLASLGAMSLLTIASRHHQHRSHNALTMHHSKVIERQLPASSHHEIHGKHGTRVTVRNLFGNLPVRVKQRGIVAAQKTEHGRLWEALKREVTGLMLSWREPVSLRVRTADGISSIGFSGTVSTKHKAGPRSSELHTMLNILTQASYILHKGWPSWVPVSASTSSVSIKGAISLDPASSRRIQFISLGVSPLTTDSGHNELYDEINRIFALSSFGIIEDDVDEHEDEKIRRQRDNRFKHDGYTKRQLKARKGVDRYPMFHLRLLLKHGSNPSRVESLFGEDGITLGTVMEILNAMITEWLAVHHFRPRKPPNKRIRGPPSSTSTASANSNDGPSRLSHAFGSHATPAAPPSKSTEVHSRKRKRSKACLPEKGSERNHHLAFSEWTRIKSGNASFFGDLSKKGETRQSTEGAEPPAMASKPQMASHSAKSNMEPIRAGSLNGGALFGHALAKDEPLDEDKYDEAVPWTDPTTKQTYLINTRTGCVLSRHPTRPHTAASNSVRASTLNDFNKPLRLPQKTGTPGSDSTPWLDGVLRLWHNPVFKPAETRIQQTTHNEDEHDHNCKHKCRSSVESNEGFCGSSASSTSKLSRIGLENAEVVAQLDKKFILAKMNSSTNADAGLKQNGDVLVLIDQHAADERIRVETLLAKLCEPPQNSTQNYRSQLGHQSLVAFTALDKPIQFTVSTQEQELFTAHAARFAAWGILFDTTPPTASSTPPQPLLSVTTLPPIISERCRADPQILITFLRSAVWKFADALHLPHLSSNAFAACAEDEAGWVRRISSCPDGLIDLVNSRACRSAIMFNDELSLEECAELVSKLCKCVFPFMCAHGRPSMVPLVHIGAVGTVSSVPALGLGIAGVAEPKGAFIAAWKRWQVK